MKVSKLSKIWLNDIKDHIKYALTKWNENDLFDSIAIEWDYNTDLENNSKIGPLGEAESYFAKINNKWVCDFNKIKFNFYLWDYIDEDIKKEVAIHEAAHIVNYHKTLSKFKNIDVDTAITKCNGHGKSWQNLVKRCNVPARASISVRID